MDAADKMGYKQTCLQQFENQLNNCNIYPLTKIKSTDNSKTRLIYHFHQHQEQPFNIDLYKHF